MSWIEPAPRPPKIFSALCGLKTASGFACVRSSDWSWSRKSWQPKYMSSCRAFSPGVMRPTRSLTRSSTGKPGCWYAGTASWADAHEMPAVRVRAWMMEKKIVPRHGAMKRPGLFFMFTFMARNGVPDVMPGGHRQRFSRARAAGCHPRLHRSGAVSYTHLRAHETRHDLVCRLL